ILTLRDEALVRQAREEMGWMADVIHKTKGWLESKSIGERILSPFQVEIEKARQMVNIGQANILQTTGVVVADAINLFVSTLINKWLEKKIYGKGFNLSYNPETGWKWPWSKEMLEVEKSGPPPAQISDVTQAKNYFADTSIVALKGTGEYEILSRFIACPTDEKYTSPENCVIDQGFYNAIQQQLTIREAMEKNLLHGDWLVGGFGLKDTNRDYSFRYSLTNIKKLRKARIVPLGLEIAAQKISSGDLGVAQYTLKAIVDGFNQLSSDNDCSIYIDPSQTPKPGSTEKKCLDPVGTWDSGSKCCKRNDECLVSASPFCRLVNPNWVLKVPSMRCDTLAYSAVPMAGLNQRQEVCVDMKDCIQEDEAGQCLTYAYCTREKNIWRMGGDACPKQFASCQLYQRTSDKKEFSYIKNTLDFDNCDQNNVGCKWYCYDYGKGLAANNQDIWACKEPGVSYKKDASGHYSEVNKANVIFFNRKVDKCDKRSEGCHEYIRTKAGLETNLVPNGNFDTFEGTVDNDQEDTFSGWKNNNSNSWVHLYAVSTGYNDKNAVKVEVSDNAQYAGIVSEDIKIDPQPYERYFAFSARIFIPADSNLTGQWELHTQAFYSGNPHGNYHWYETINQASDYQFNQDTEKGNWLKLNKIIKTRKPEDAGPNENVDTLRIFVITSGTGGSGTVIIDQMQINELINPNSPVPDYKEYGSINKVYLKKAPDWMNCYDNDPQNDDPNCYNFVLKCEAKEVGCELYTPTNGDPALPAVASSSDRCPADCQGYETFREMDTNFETGRLAVAFIPATGRTCPASEVGCEEFTNLDTVAQGGEGKEYYSYLRPCRKPDNQCSYYFTWVGSETTGYQLKRYYL
ncbi:MAG: hypothetical protein ABIK19_05530, partial [candidate division WOR-3 bacterium]